MKIANSVIDLVGNTTRWDNPMLYTPVPTALGLTFGVKYDQRAQERFPAANINLTFRSGRLIAQGETNHETTAKAIRVRRLVCRKARPAV